MTSWPGFSRWLVVAATTALLMVSCSRSYIVSRPEEQKLDDAYGQLFTREAARAVQDGDIVLRRGYAVLSDLLEIHQRAV